MYPPSHVLVFLLGCIGALAPEIVRLYKLRHRPPKSIISLWYFVTTAVYAALGGVVAVTLPAVTLWGALYAGITTPVLISTAAKHREEITKPVPSGKRDRNFIQAIDHSREMANYLPAKKNVKASRFGEFIEFIRNHADGLFL
jgi:hypothetical protein